MLFFFKLYTKFNKYVIHNSELLSNFFCSLIGARGIVSDEGGKNFFEAHTDVLTDKVSNNCEALLSIKIHICILGWHLGMHLKIHENVFLEQKFAEKKTIIITWTKVSVKWPGNS